MWADVTIEAAANEEKTTRALRVSKITREAQDIASFELVDSLGLELPPFTAGAHLDVRINDDIRRQYSLCNDPQERDRAIDPMTLRRYFTLHAADREEVGRCRGAANTLGFAVQLCTLRWRGCGRTSVRPSRRPPCASGVFTNDSSAPRGNTRSRTAAYSGRKSRRSIASACTCRVAARLIRRRS